MPISLSDPRLLRLKKLEEEKAVLRGDFTLASGVKSKYYFDGRKVTTDAEGVFLIGELVEEIVHEAKIEAIGGPATAALPIITAVQIAAHLKKRPLPGFYVRSEKKAHGTGQLVEGNLPKTRGARVAMVDDTMTTGASLLRAIEAAEEAGCKVAKVIVIVDRQQGGSEAMKQKGYELVALFKADGNGNIL